MAINRIDLRTDDGFETLINLTGDTVTKESLVQGMTAHGANGEILVGENPYELQSTNQTVDEQTDIIDQIKAVLKNKAAGGGEVSVPEYQRVDYIQFAGKQIVDTGIICNQNTKVQTYFTRESSAQEYLYGVASSNNTASVTAYLGGSWRFGNKNATKPLGTISEIIGYGAFVDASQIAVTGSVTGIAGVNEFETVGTLLIGSCRSSAGEVGSAQYDGKIFFFAMWEGEEQVLKLVPVVNKDGVYGFFDEISETFFESITDTPLEGGKL